MLRRYLDGTCSEEEERLVNQWYNLIEEEIPDPVTEKEMQKIENRLWNKIHGLTLTPGSSLEKDNTRKPIYKIWVKSAAVAAIIFILAIGIYLSIPKHRSTIPALTNAKAIEGIAFTEEVNDTRQVKHIKLEDGSEVQLLPGSRISFPRHFLKNKREVYFEGEGFFEVTKNPLCPFFVYNNKLVTEVLGTSFHIRIVNNKIEVAVRTGRVAVYENGQRTDISGKKGDNGVIITPNEKVTYYTNERHFVTSLVEAPMPVHSPDKHETGEPIKFVYDDTPLVEVLHSIEKSYEIEILIENDAINNCSFSGDITSQSLYDKLELICQAFQASYEIKGTKILVKGGKGCN
ncbi:MAG: FecR family protein [Bacteroidota bacterium]